MIDLSETQLQNSIILQGGNTALINTDFRVWIQFYRILKLAEWSNLDFADFNFIFVENPPEITMSVMESLYYFYSNPNPLPLAFDGGGAVIGYDYDIDSEYIYSAFLGQYGIDLLEINLHWHKFKALFLGLNKNCKLSEIMELRFSQQKEHQKLKAMWLIEPETKKDERTIAIEECLRNGGDLQSVLNKI